MAKTKDTSQINDNFREQAFLLQFEGEEYGVRAKLGLDEFGYYNGCPIGDMKVTGLFGIIDALIDLGLTGREIIDFYIHGHVEPYADPCKFTAGIIEIVHGMPKDEIKNKYGRYFDDERIAKLPNPNRNTQMLLSFCYDKDDTYVFIPDKNDLYNHFAKNYSNRHKNWIEFITEKDFQRVDGKIFRAVYFLVRHGYDFPELESLTNKKIKNITLRQTNGNRVFLLNKEYARKMSDIILAFVYFLKRNNCDILNPEYMFDMWNNSVTLIDSKGNQIVLNRSDVEPNVNKYTPILQVLSNHDFKVPDTISLCDKKVKRIEIKYSNISGTEYSLNISRDLLLSISPNWLNVINKAYSQGLTFPDHDNLFDSNQKLLNVVDQSGKEHAVVREQFDQMLDIVIHCKKAKFSINFSQLLDISYSAIEVFDEQGKKYVVNRAQIILMMNTFLLLTQNGYHFNDCSSLFDENNPYIIVLDELHQERAISRKQIYKIIKLQGLSDKKNLTDSEKDLLFMLNNYSIRKKLFEWLPYTAKKWIPSSAVVNKISAGQSHEYFYNHNHERLKVLKDAYNPKNYDEMEGIVSIGYILGLFDSKESISQKAMNYIIDHFLKKGVTADKLHTTYGAIDLTKGYNRKFAEFFMKHYAINSEAFIESDLGVNMTKEVFERFDEILESRPEKRIKTRTMRKLLTPIDAMASIMNIEVDREMLGEKALDERYVRLVELLMKFGAGKDELKWAIELYEQALTIDEQKVSIPYIEDLNPTLMKFTSHLKSDPQAFVSGRKTNCCSTYGGHAQDRLTHVITDPDWRYVSFTTSNRTFFDGLVWYDKENQVVCIDNVEGQFSIFDKIDADSIAMMADTIIRYADELYLKMNELHIPCIKVNVGIDPGTASWRIFSYASRQGLIDVDNNPCNYPIRNGITTDAQRQFTITDERILSHRRIK